MKSRLREQEVFPAYSGIHPLDLINSLIIMTTLSSQTLSFSGLTGESRKALDARFRPAGMTDKPQWRFTKRKFNYATLNNCKIAIEFCNMSPEISKIAG